MEIFVKHKLNLIVIWGDNGFASEIEGLTISSQLLMMKLNFKNELMALYSDNNLKVIDIESKKLM